MYDDELMNDDSCGICQHGIEKENDEWGNPEYIYCKLNKSEMSTDDICKSYNS